MASFNLTAEINLRGPSNLSKIAGDIRRELSSIKTDLNLKISNQSSKSIDNVTNSIKQLNEAIIQAQSNASGLSSVLGGLGQSTQTISSGTTTAAKGMIDLSSATASTSKQIAAASSEMADFGRQSAVAVRRFAAFSIPTGAIYGLARAFSSAFKEFVDFDRQIVRLQQTTGGFKSDIDSINTEVRRLSVSFGVSSKDLIEASVTLAQAGLSANQTKDALEALAKSALAPSFDSITETTEGAIAAFRQFGIETRDLESVLGSINAVAAAFAVESSDIISAIQRTGGVFATASKGVSEGSDALNEFIAVFTSIRATTRESAETIATGLRTIFTRVQRGSTIEALRDFGIELTNAQDKFVGAYEAVRRLSEGLSRLDPRSGEFAAIAEELGGFRQIGKVIPLIQQFATAQEALNIAQQGQGSLSSSAIQAQSALAVQFSKTREEFLAFVEALGRNKTFQNLISLGLTLTSTLIKVASAFQPLLPYLAILGGIKAASAATQFAGGFLSGVRKTPENTDTQSGNILETLLGSARNKEKTDSTINARLETVLSENTTALTNVTSAIRSLENTINRSGTTGPTTELNSGGKVLAFARGGVVPGTGSRDTVPAMLMPGEFVIRKKAVETLGANNLQKINKYAYGGKVKDLANIYPSISYAFGYDEVENDTIKDASKDVYIDPSQLSKAAIKKWKASKDRPWKKFEDLVSNEYGLQQDTKSKWALLDFPSQRSESKFMEKGSEYADPDSLKGNNDQTIAAKNYLFEQSVIKNPGNVPNVKVEELEKINNLPPATVYWASPQKFNQAGLFNRGGIIQKLMAGGVAEEMTSQTNAQQPSSLDDLLKRIQDLGGTTDLYKYISKPEISDIMTSSGLTKKPTASQLVDSRWLRKTKPDIFGDRSQYIPALTKVVEEAEAGYKEAQANAMKKAGLQAQAGIANKFGLLSIYPVGYNDLSEVKELTTGSGQKLLTQIVMKGLPSRYQKAISDIENELASAPTRAAEALQYTDIFGTGTPLAFDFDKTLVNSDESLFAGANGGIDFAKFNDLNLVKQGLEAAELTLLGEELKRRVQQTPELLDSIRILSARPQSNAPLLSDTLNRLGLPISSDKITGVSGAENKIDNLSFLETLIDDRVATVEDIKNRPRGLGYPQGRAIAYTEPTGYDPSSASSRRNRTTMMAANAEELAKRLGINISAEDDDNPLRPIDYPNGVGAYANFWDVPSNMPSDIKVTNNNSAEGRLWSEIERYYKKFGRGGMLTEAMSASQSPQGQAIQRYKEILSSILPPEMLTETGFLKQPSGKPEPIEIITADPGQAAVNTVEKAYYAGGLLFKALRSRIEKSKSLLSNQEYDALKSFVDQNLAFEGNEDVINLKGAAHRGTLAHESFHDIQGYLYDNYPEIMDKLFSAVEMSYKDIEAWYASGSSSWTGPGNYTLNNLFPTPRSRSPYPSTIAKTASAAVKKRIKSQVTPEESFKTIAQAQQDFGRLEAIPVLIGASSEGDSEATRILSNIFSTAGLNPDFYKTLPKFADGGVATVDGQKQTEKEYGKIGLRDDGSSISATYFRNNQRSGNVSAYKMRDYLYYVGISQATGGYGPRLYDVVMEAATANGAMLTSDRSSVSGDAKGVWEYYFNNRPDVRKTPLLKPEDWTKNQALIDPKLYGPEDTWPPFDDPAWVLQSGYSKQPSLISDPNSVIRMDQSMNSGSLAANYFAASASKFAKGGSAQDTVPALLTPGEFVINKKAAQKIGYSQLHRLNKADKIQGYNTGGIVGNIQRFAEGGGAKYKPEDFVSLINYSDVTGVQSAITDNGMKYAKALADAANALGDIKPIEDLAKTMQETLKKQLGDIGLQPSQFGISQSWAMWDIGKQLHLKQNPSESSNKYRLADPLSDPQLQQEMIDRMAGWEIGKAKGNIASSSWRLTEVGKEARLAGASPSADASDGGVEFARVLDEISQLDEAKAKFIDVSSAVGQSLDSISDKIKDSIIKTAITTRRSIEQQQKELSAYIRIARETGNPDALEPAGQNIQNIYKLFGEEIDTDKLNAVLEDVFKRIQLKESFSDIVSGTTELNKALNSPIDDLIALDIAVKKATETVGTLLPEMIPDELDIRAQRSVNAGRFRYGNARDLQASIETPLGRAGEYLGGNRFPGIGLLEKQAPKLAENLGKATEAAGGFVSVIGGASMFLGSRLPDIYTNLDKLAGTSLSTSTNAAGLAKGLSEAGGAAVGFAKLAQSAGMSPLGVGAASLTGLALGGAQGFIEGQIGKEMELTNKRVATSEANLAELFKEIQNPSDRGRFNELRTEIIKEYAAINREVGDISRNTAEETRTWLLNLGRAAKEAATAFITVQAILAGLSLAKAATGKSRGGKIAYYAKGGNVFEPKGTDTVPAMLTPGEFVVNKKATSKNLSLLKSINNGTYMSRGGVVEAALAGAGESMYQAFVPPNVPITVVLKGFATEDKTAGRPSTGYFGTLSDTFNPFDADFYRTTGRTEDEIYRLGARVSGVTAIFAGLAAAATGLGGLISVGGGGAATTAATSWPAGAMADVAAKTAAGGATGLTLGKTISAIGSFGGTILGVKGAFAALAAAAVALRSIFSSTAQNEKQRQNLLSSPLAEQAIKYAPLELANVPLKDLQNRLTQGKDLTGIERSQFFTEASGILESAQRIKLEEAGLRNAQGVTIGETPETSVRDFVNALDAGQKARAENVIESTKLELVLQKYIDQQKQISARAGTPDVEKTLTAEIDRINQNIKVNELSFNEIIDAIKKQDPNLNKEVKNAIESGLRALGRAGEPILKQAEADRLGTVTRIQVDRLNNALNVFEAAINKASDVFQDAARDRELSIGTRLGGKATISKASNKNLTVLNNLLASSNDDIARAIQNVTGGLGFDKELTDVFKQRILTEKILTQDLPNIIGKSIARNATLGARDPGDEVDTAFIANEVTDALKNVVGEDFAKSIGGKVSDLITKPSREGGPLANAKDLINDQKALKNVIDQVVALSPVLKRSEEARLKTLNEVNQRLQEYSDALVQITNLEIQAGKIRTEGANSIDKALNRTVSMDRLFKPFNDEISRLTTIPNIAQDQGAAGAGIRQAGTLDPLEIRKRLDFADDLRAGIQKELDRAATIPDQKDREKEVSLLTNKLGKITAEGEKLRLALNKLATDGQRAALSLAKIQDLRQAQQGGRNILTDIIKNVNNPEWQVDFVNSVDAYSRALTGNIQNFELPQAVAGLEKIVSMVPQAQGEELTKQFFDNVLTKIGREDPTLAATLDFIKNQLGLRPGRENPEIEAEVGRARMLFEEQRKATEQLKERMEAGANILFTEVEKSAQLWSATVTESAKLLKESIKPQEFELKRDPNKPEPPAAGNAAPAAPAAPAGAAPAGAAPDPATVLKPSVIQDSFTNALVLTNKKLDTIAEILRTVDREDLEGAAVKALTSNNTKLPTTYASTGKYINFKPKGSDTVPAMLTPGEFVVNREATRKNLPLLKSINSGGSLQKNGMNYFADGTNKPLKKYNPFGGEIKDLGPNPYAGGSPMMDLSQSTITEEEIKRRKAAEKRYSRYFNGRLWREFFEEQLNGIFTPPDPKITARQTRKLLNAGKDYKKGEVFTGVPSETGQVVSDITGLPIVGKTVELGLSVADPAVMATMIGTAGLGTGAAFAVEAGAPTTAAGIAYATGDNEGAKEALLMAAFTVAAHGAFKLAELGMSKHLSKQANARLLEGANFKPNEADIELAAKNLAQRMREAEVAGVHGTKYPWADLPDAQMRDSKGIFIGEFGESPKFTDPNRPGMGNLGPGKYVGTETNVPRGSLPSTTTLEEAAQTAIRYAWDGTTPITDARLVLTRTSEPILESNIARVTDQSNLAARMYADELSTAAGYQPKPGETIKDVLNNSIDTYATRTGADEDALISWVEEIKNKAKIKAVEGPNTFIEGPGAPPGTSRAIATDVPITLESIKLMDLFRKEVHFHLSPLADKLGIEAAKIAQEKYAHSIDIQHHANGGLIYANDGKYINFKPKGTDTVPAMLTPGEFVVNAKSTKNNLSLLKSINNGQNPDYFQNGGMIGSYGAGGNSGGGRPSQSGVLDIESLNSAFDNFSRSVDSLKSVIDSFVQTGNKISSAFGQLNSIESGAAKLSVAAASINSASNNFNNTINGFNTSLRSLERAISRIPSNISLNINGSIPVNVTVEMNGEAVQQDMPQLRDEVIGAVENAIRDAMPGININIRR
jgi:TP901 family phage tail tape measure protein